MQARTDAEDAKVDLTDPGWRDVWNSDNFKLWYMTGNNAILPKLRKLHEANELVDATTISGAIREFKKDDARYWSERKTLVGDWKCKFSKSGRSIVWRLREDSKVLWATGDDKPVGSSPSGWSLGYDRKIHWAELVEGNETTRWAASDRISNLNSWGFEMLNSDGFAVAKCSKCLPLQCQ